MGKIVPTEIARLIAAQRRIETRPCLVCGAPTTGIALRRYCSTTCRVKAAYQRDPQKHRATRRARYRREHTQPEDKEKP